MIHEENGGKKGNSQNSQAAGKQLKEQPGILLGKGRTLFDAVPPCQHLSSVSRLQPSKGVQQTPL